jgi:hypothetical protein
LIILFVCTGPEAACAPPTGAIVVAWRVVELDMVDRDVVEENVAEGADICEDLELELWLIV